MVNQSSRSGGGKTATERETEAVERKRYLELCQQSSVGIGVRVLYKGIQYAPKGYELRFDKSGSSVHRAILKDRLANSLIYCKLEEVFEDEKKG